MTFGDSRCKNNEGYLGTMDIEEKEIADDSPSTDSSFPTYADIAQTPLKKMILTVSERVTKLQQVNTEELSVNTSYFDTMFAMSWSGANKKDKIENVWVKLVVAKLSEAFQQSNFKLTILPALDSEYLNGLKWFCNEVETQSKITSFCKL